MEQPSPIGKKLRMIHNKFREVADRNLEGGPAGDPGLSEMQRGGGDPPAADRGMFQLKNPTVTGLLNRLEEKGFLTRRPNPNDRRYRVVELTEKGGELLSQMWEEARGMENKIYSGFSEEELGQLSGFLDRILDSLSEENKEHAGGTIC